MTSILGVGRVVFLFYTTVAMVVLKSASLLILSTKNSMGTLKTARVL
jgi:hypothetical protein